MAPFFHPQSSGFGRKLGKQKETQREESDTFSGHQTKVSEGKKNKGVSRLPISFFFNPSCNILNQCSLEHRVQYDRAF